MTKNALLELDSKIKVQTLTLEQALSSSENAFRVLGDLGAQIPFVTIRGDRYTLLGELKSYMTNSSAIPNYLSTYPALFEGLGFLKTTEESLVVEILRQMKHPQPWHEAQRLMRQGEKGACRLYTPRCVLLFLILIGSKDKSLPEAARKYFGIVPFRGYIQTLLTRVEDIVSTQEKKPESKVVQLIPNPPAAPAPAYKPEAIAALPSGPVTQKTKIANSEKTVHADASVRDGSTVIAVYDPEEGICYIDRTPFAMPIEQAEAGAISFAKSVFPGAAIANDNKSVVSQLMEKEAQLKIVDSDPNKRFVKPDCTLREIASSGVLTKWEPRTKLTHVDRLTKMGHDIKVTGKFKVEIVQDKDEPDGFRLKLDRIVRPFEKDLAVATSQPSKQEVSTSADPAAMLRNLIGEIEKERKELGDRKFTLELELAALAAQDSNLTSKKAAFELALDALAGV